MNILPSVTFLQTVVTPLKQRCSFYGAITVQMYCMYSASSTQALHRLHLLCSSVKHAFACKPALVVMIYPFCLASFSCYVKMEHRYCFIILLRLSCEPVQTICRKNTDASFPFSSAFLPPASSWLVSTQSSKFLNTWRFLHRHLYRWWKLNGPEFAIWAFRWGFDPFGRWVGDHLRMN